MPDVFISYSRRDKEFVRKLHGELAKLNRDVWVDWEDIPATADWWKEIQNGIEGADTFIFIITPDSLDSEVCRREIDYAVANNKRFVPILRRDAFGDGTTGSIRADVHPAISSHNWIYFRDEDDFAKSFKTLLEAIDTDLSYVREHTRLLLRAREWEQEKRRVGLLLSGDETHQAEIWLAAAQGKTPAAGELHLAYIHASRQAQNSRQRRALLAVVAAFVVTILLAIYGLTQAQIAGNNAATAQVRVTEVAQQAATAQAAQGTAVFEADRAEANAITAQANYGLAQSNFGTAQAAQGTAVFEAQRAEDNAGTAAANAVQALNNAATATFEQGRAENNAATAAVAQGRAENEANNAATAAAQAQLAATAESNARATSVVNEQLAIDSAATAVVAQGRAENEANNAATAAAQAQLAATAESNARATSVVNEQLAIDNAATAAFEQNRAENNAVTATIAQGRAENEANNAATAAAQAQLAATAESNARATSVVNEQLAIDSAATAVVAQGRAENEANNAATAAAQAQLAATAESNARATSVVNEQLAIDSAATAAFEQNRAENEANNAATAQGEAELQAEAAATSAAQAQLAATAESNARATNVVNEQLAISNAVTAQVAQATAVYNESQARAQALAVSGQQLLDAGNSDLAIALAIEAGGLNADVTEAQRLLNRAAPYAVRYGLTEASQEITETFRDSLGREKTRQVLIFSFSGLFSPDNRYFVNSEDGSSLSIWDLSIAGDQPMYRLVGHRTWVTKAVFTPDSRYLVSGSENGDLIVWDMQSGALIQHLSGHTARITALAANPLNVQQIVSGSADKSAILWDVVAGTQTFRLSGFGGEVNAAFFSEDGSRAFAFAVNQDEPRVGRLPSESNRGFSNVDRYRGFNDTGTIAFTGGDGSGFLKLWNAARFVELREFRLGNANEDYINQVVFSPNGAWVLVHSEGRAYSDRDTFSVTRRSVELWRIADGEVEYKLDFGFDEFDPQIWNVFSLAFSPDGRYALIGGLFDRVHAVILWDIEARREVRRFTGHNRAIMMIGFSPDSQYAFSIAEAATRVWDISEREASQIKTLNPGSRSVTDIAFAPFPIIADNSAEGGGIVYEDSQPIVYGKTSSGTVVAWDMLTNQQTIQPITVGIASFFAYNTQQTQMVVASSSTTSEFSQVVLYDMTTGQFSSEPDSVHLQTSAAAYSTDGRTVVFGGSLPVFPGNGRAAVDTYSLIIWDSETGRTLREIAFPDDLKEIPITRVALSPDAAYALSLSVAGDGTQNLVLWDVESGSEFHRLTNYNSPISAIAFNPNGRTIVAALGPNENVVRTWDISTGDEILNMIGHRGAVNALAFSPDGETLLSGSDDGAMILWDTNQGQLLSRFVGHRDAISSVAFSRDGRLALSASAQDGIVVWRIETLQETIAWIKANRHLIELTCAQRYQYNVRPYCIEGIVPTITPTGTLFPTATPTITLTPTATPTPTETPIPYALIDSSQAVNLREGPGQGFRIIRGLRPGTRVIVLQTSGDTFWTQVQVVEDNSIGWVLTNVVQKET